MVGRGVEPEVWARVDGPTPQRVACQRRTRLDLQRAAVHAVVGLNRLGLLDPRLGDNLQVHDPRPLLIGLQRLVIGDLAIDLLSLGNPGEDKIAKSLAFEVISAQLPAPSVATKATGAVPPHRRRRTTAATHPAEHFANA